jgi:sec-independent protein translocase protein TatA
MGNFRGWEWILILLLALLLFGGFKKLPDAARGIGRSLRIFKAETKGLHDDDDESQPADSAAEQTGDAASAATPAAITSADDSSTLAADPGDQAPQAHPVSSKPDNSSSATNSGSSERHTS